MGVCGLVWCVEGSFGFRTVDVGSVTAVLWRAEIDGRLATMAVARQ